MRRLIRQGHMDTCLWERRRGDRCSFWLLRTPAPSRVLKLPGLSAAVLKTKSPGCSGAFLIFACSKTIEIVYGVAVERRPWVGPCCATSTLSVRDACVGTWKSGILKTCPHGRALRRHLGGLWGAVGSGGAAVRTPQLLRRVVRSRLLVATVQQAESRSREAAPWGVMSRQLHAPV